MSGRVNPSDPAWHFHGWEHLQRYRFGMAFVAGARVLDVACGVGYGSQILKQAGAREVVGVDNDPDTIAAARRRPALPQVEFQVGDAQALAPELGVFDVAVSFETIEHLPEPKRFVASLHQRLKPGGRLILSAPNTLQFQRAPVPIDNDRHLSEPTYAELKGWLAPHFHVEQEWEQSTVERGIHQIHEEFGHLHSLLLVRAEMAVRRWLGRSIRFQPDRRHLRAHTEIMPLLPERQTASQQFLFVCRRRDDV
jgi:2-polyprenyl-3-methyl-5-hydroxy-6-metoxy-1,4-benzoquinol methylase